MTSLPSGTIGVTFTSTRMSLGDNCGAYTFQQPTVPSGSLSATAVGLIGNAQSDALAAAYGSALMALNPYFDGSICTAGTTSIPCFLGDNAANMLPPPADLVGPIATVYQHTLSSKIASAVAGLSQNPATTTSTWSSQGWLAAGAYFNGLTRVQSELESSAAQIPRVTDPILSHEPEAHARIARALYLFRNWANISSLQFGSSSPTFSLPTSLSSANDPTFWDSLAQEYQNLKKTIGDEIAGNKFSFIDIISRLADLTAAMSGVWTPMASETAPMSLGVQLTSSTPLIEMSRLGHANLNTAYRLLDLSISLGMGGGIVEGLSSVVQAAAPHLAGNKAAQVGAAAGGIFSAFVSMTGAGLVAVGGVLGFLALLFFSAGFVLAYFLPLIPFITFTLNAVTWIVTVLEAVVMVPLVALAHVNPEGDGLPGSQAKTAYFFIFGILLRPALMTFGLICGYLVFITGIVFMNQLFLLAVNGASGIGQDVHVFMSRLFYSTIYVVILYIVCKNAFKLIGAFPDHALSWIGAPASAPREPIGEAESLGGMVTNVSALAGSQMFPQVTQNAAQIGGALKNFGSNLAGTIPPKRTPPAPPP